MPICDIHCESAATRQWPVCCCPCAGRSAAWLARLTGGQKVGGSNPLAPIVRIEHRIWLDFNLALNPFEKTPRAEMTHSVQSVPTLRSVR